jgi:hypothetical protein
MTPRKGNRPRRITDGTCLLFCPTSGRTLVMGFHPLFSFNCGRRTGALSRALAPQPGEAWLTFGWYIFHQEPSCCRFHLPRSKDWVSRDIPDARTSGLHRIDRDLDDAFASWHRALGAWEVTAAIAIFSLGTESLRLKPSRVNTKPSSKFFVKLERLKNVREPDGRFPFPRKALSDRRCAPRPAWI